MIITFTGCCHGELDALYRKVADNDVKTGKVTELVVISGDFQAVRSVRDLSGLSCPAKYRKVGDFTDYYHRLKRAPYLTLVIGGNHEEHAYFSALYIHRC